MGPDHPHPASCPRSHRLIINRAATMARAAPMRERLRELAPLRRIRREPCSQGESLRAKCPDTGLQFAKARARHEAVPEGVGRGSRWRSEAKRHCRGLRTDPPPGGPPGAYPPPCRSVGTRRPWGGLSAPHPTLYGMNPPLRGPRRACAHRNVPSVKPGRFSSGVASAQGRGASDRWCFLVDGEFRRYGAGQVLPGRWPLLCK